MISIFLQLFRPASYIKPLPDHIIDETYQKLRMQIFLTICIGCAGYYLVRYWVVDWIPTYLQSAKGFSANKSSWSYFLYELAGIPGTILCGYLSDRVFQGRRAPIGVLYLALVTLAILVYWLYNGDNIVVYNAVLIVIGFLIYGPVLLFGLQALDMVPDASPQNH